MKKILGVLIAVFMLCLGVNAEEKYLLKLKSEKGDKITRESDSNFKAKQKVEQMTGLDEKNVNMEVSMDINEKLKRIDTVLETNDKGMSGKVKREIILHKEDIKTDPPIPKGEEYTCEGAEIFITDTNGEMKADYKKTKNTKANEAMLRNFAAAQFTLDSEYGLYFPDDKVGVNDEWNVDSKKIEKQSMQVMKMPMADNMKLKNFSGSVKCKLSSVKEENKQKIAVISMSHDINISFEMQAPEGNMGKINMEGNMNMKGSSTLEFNITEGHILSYLFNGDMKQGIKMEMSSESRTATTKTSVDGTVSMSDKFSYSR